MGGFAYGAVFGNKLEHFGPRVTGMIGSASLLAGFALVGVASGMHNLPLLYAGGAVWGLANGWSYVPPVATLVKWFPERKGFASGMCLLGYGGGAIIAAPLFTTLVDRFKVLPHYVGAADDIDIINHDGKLFVEMNEVTKEVVVAAASDIQSSGFSDLAQAGVYLTNTGSTGVVETLMVMGCGYSVVMLGCAFVFRLPPEHFVPPGLVVTEEENSQTLTTHNTSVEDAMKSKQFWLLYAGFGTAIIGAYGLISSAKLMMNETFGSALPHLVTTGFTTSFVAAMSAANLTGRLAYPLLSDALGKKIGGDPFWGRKYTYTGMWATTPFLYGGIIYSVHSCSEAAGPIPLGIFAGSVLGILSSFGGATSNRPAMVADLFGIKSMSTITARQLSVVLPAAFIGPQIVAQSRQSSSEKAIFQLAEQVDDAVFHHAFGAGKETLPILIQNKSISIARLMEMLPSSVQDPTPFLYDNAMIICGGLNCLALAANLLTVPLDREPEK